jgi:homocysteine S-methyltransferase
MKVTERCKSNDLLFICDYSPPRSADLTTLSPTQNLDADYVCVAYNPGRRVRVDSAMYAAAIKQQSGRDVIFNLSPRDMNKLALQSHLLGAQMLGLDNVLVVHGDHFTEKDLTAVSSVRDYKATELMQAIKGMNEGQDYKGSKLETATDLCIGASIDLGRGLEREASLTQRKVLAGADFFITQPVFSLDNIRSFHDAYSQNAGSDLTQPVFWGVQVLQQGGIIFSNVPESIRAELEDGRDGVHIALEQVKMLRTAGIQTIYLVAPILRGGARDYAAAQRVITATRSA